MGIVNATPDSFSDGYPSLKSALEHTANLIEAGVDILDIGGESTRPGSQSVAHDEECRRVLPLIREVRRMCDIPISLDTQKASIAKVAVDEGVAIINHVSASLDYAEMLPILKHCDAGYVAMHMRERPKTMQHNPEYSDPLNEVATALKRVAHAAGEQGIHPDRLIYDPGIGFGKKLEHNLALLKGLTRLGEDLGRPILLGLSRKSWLNHFFDQELTDLGERDAYTALATVLLNQPMVLCHRVHHVAQVKRSLKLAATLKQT